MYNKILDVYVFFISGLNLTLKTPFVEKRTERTGLHRKVSNRRLPSVDAFDEAVQKCLEQAPYPGLHTDREFYGFVQFYI